MSSALIYTVSYTNPLSHLVHFSLQIPSHAINTSSLTLQLPLWRPGRYERQNYAQNVYKLHATDAQGNELSATKISTNVWQVVLKENTGYVVVTYDYYAAHMDAGGCWLDTGQLYLNWVACALQVKEMVVFPYEIDLQIPTDYLIACSLPKQKNKLYAENFYALVDAPLIASNQLQHRKLKIEETDFYLWFLTDADLPWQRLEEDFTKMIATQIEFFGEFPTKEYHFLFQLLPYRHYHGVEHRNSTVITLGPSENIHEPELYNELLGISSHELFHAWNVARIRPKEFIPYTFEKETYFTTGFMLEGITTFYGDYLLWKAGIWDTPQFVAELNKMMKRHFTNAGRFHYSLVEASLDLWVDGYRQGAPNRTVSIYVKGALVTLLLHIILKSKTEDSISFHDIVRMMWQRFGKEEKGYTYEEFLELMQEAGGEECAVLARELIETTTPLETLFNTYLPRVGATLEGSFPESPWEMMLGIKLNTQLAFPQVTAILPDSAGALYFSLGDEIVAINNKKATQANLALLLESSENIKFTYFRQNRLCSCSIAMGTLQPTGETYNIAVISGASLSI